MLAKTRKTRHGAGSIDLRLILRVLFWTVYLIALGLAHVHLRLVARDMEIQCTQLQAEWKDLYESETALKSEIAQLRGGERMLAYARRKFNLVDLPPDQIVVWNLPRQLVDRYDRTYSEIVLARAGKGRSQGRESLLARLLNAVLSPEQAQARSMAARH